MHIQLSGIPKHGLLSIQTGTRGWVGFGGWGGGGGGVRETPVECQDDCQATGRHQLRELEEQRQSALEVLQAAYFWGLPGYWGAGMLQLAGPQATQANRKHRQPTGNQRCVTQFLRHLSQLPS